MNLATIAWKESSSAALVLGDRIAAVRQLPGRDDARDVLPLIVRPLTPQELDQLSGMAKADPQVRWLPPILCPPKNVLCVGRNYAEHVKDAERAYGKAVEVPEYPIWFTKAATSLIGSGAAILYDPSFTQKLDYEAELAIIIGKTCKRAAREKVYDYVFGYTVFNDVSARDVQRNHNQWFKGKSVDTYGPCGPWVVTRDAIPNPQQLDIRLTVNGEQRQHDNTRNMIFDIPTLIADISAGMTLEPGDIIATGTPTGVALGMTPQRFLNDGDEVAVEIEKIGRLVNRVKKI